MYRRLYVCSITLGLLNACTSRNSASVMFFLAGYINSSYYSPLYCRFLPVMDGKGIIRIVDFETLCDYFTKQVEAISFPTKVAPGDWSI